MAKLIIESGPLRGRQFRLPASGVLGIGRDEKCAVRLEDAMLSRVHCVLRGEGGKWALEDRGSLNGTCVNDEPITRHALVAGDVIQVGDTLLSFAPSDEDPLVGATLGGYRIERRLGRGAMGTVYLARQLSLDREIALKILAPSLSQNAEFVRRFLDEARAAGRLNHPNVVQVYDAGQGSVDGEGGSLHFMSMEYLSEGSLQELLDSEGPMSPEDAVAAALDAAQALAFAEQQGIVHRDIKPANLLIASDGTVKVGDLGIATDLRQLASGAEDEPRRIAGSPRYMAPEQARGEAVDHRADVYALGSTLFRAIAGVPPFDGASIKEILRAKIEQDPPSLRRLSPDVSPALSAVVDRMLARDPDRRFSSAGECHQALEAAMRAKTPRRRKRGRSARSGRSVRAARPTAPLPPASLRTSASEPRSGSRPGRAPVASVSNDSKLLRLGGMAILSLLLLFGLLITVSRLNKRGDGAPEASTAPEAPGEAEKRAAPVASVTPKADPEHEKREAELARARERLRAIEAALEDSQPEDSARLVAEARAIAKSAPGLATEVQALLARLETLRSADRATSIDGAREELDRQIAAGDLPLAARFLAGLDPGVRDALADRAAAITREAEALVAREAPSIGALIDAGDLDAATTAIENLRARLPEASVAGNVLFAELSRRIEEARRAQDRAKGRLASTVRLAIGRQAWDEAEAAIIAVFGPDALATPASEEGALSAEPELALAVDEFRLARAAWRRLEESFDREAKARGTVSVSLLSSPTAAGLTPEPGTATRVRLLERSDGIVRGEVGSGARRAQVAFGVLDLDAAQLGELCDRSKSEELIEPSEVPYALGLLSLYTSGPTRARAALESRRISAERKAALELAIATRGDLWIDPAFDRVVRRFEALAAPAEEASGAPSRVDLFEHLAMDLARLLRAPSLESTRRPELHRMYLESRTAALASLPPEALFHAKSFKEKDGRVILSYDFSEEAQLQDFTTVPEGAASMGWDRKRGLLELRGEVRFLAGDPFEKSILVRVDVPKGGFEAERPNVNVALWTAEADRVTPLSDGRPIDVRRWRDGDGDDKPKDYFVFGHGYFYELDLDAIGGGFGRGFGRVARNFLPGYLREPSLVLLAGEEGRSLHRSRLELLWDQPSARSIAPTGAIRASCGITDGRVSEWKLNGRPVPFTSSLELARLAEGEPHRGSASLFSNGERVWIDAAEFEGTLNGEWVRGRGRAVAERELREIDPKLATGKAPGAPIAKDP